jgi:hypothetical protein
MMNQMMRFLVLCLLLTLTGCGAVYVKAPPGTEALVLNPAEWEGEWITGDEGVMSVKVLDRDQGLLQLSTVDYDLEKQPHVSSEKVYIRKWKQFLFASVPTLREGDTPAFFWARMMRDGERVVIWLPDRGKFKALVTSGKLPGLLEKDEDVVLEDLKDHHYEILTSEKEGVLYQWDDPGVLIRLLPHRGK